MSACRSSGGTAGPGARVQAWLFAPVDVAGLVAFRIAFGALLLVEALGALVSGSVRALYIEPSYHFTYLGFDWVRPWPGAGMYVHYAVLALAALGIALGYRYRLAASVFFAGFTWVLLLDQARYLNHFYLIALLAFLLVFLPAERAFSLDARRRPARRGATAPAWTLWLLRFQVAVVYVFAGVAKLDADWLRGEPLRTWLARRAESSALGGLLAADWLPGVLSWGGMLLDLLVVPLLLWRTTRALAAVALLGFHAANFILFDIGIFPWLMAAAVPLYFAPSWPRRLFGRSPPAARPGAQSVPLPAPSRRRRRLVTAALVLWAAAQTLVPLRHFLYPGDVHWTEEGHRFSWRMKLRTKAGFARFVARDPRTGRVWTVNPHAYLTDRQVRKMSGVPDMVHQFSHYLARELGTPGAPRPEIRAHVHTSLNSRPYAPLVDPTVDLAATPRSLLPAPWILPRAPVLRHVLRFQRQDLAEFFLDVDHGLGLLELSGNLLRPLQ